MADKLSRDDVLAMATHIPNMVEDLKGTTAYTRFKVKWDLLEKNGGMGHEIVDLYMKCYEALPEHKQKMYPG